MSAITLDPRVILRAYKDALAVQDASNISGIAHSFARVFDAVRLDLESAGQANHVKTFWNVRWHPVVILYASKIGDMTGHGGNPDRFNLAYDMAQRVTGYRYGVETPPTLEIGAPAYYAALAEYFAAFINR